MLIGSSDNTGSGVCASDFTCLLLACSAHEGSVIATTKSFARYFTFHKLLSYLSAAFTTLRRTLSTALWSL